MQSFTDNRKRWTPAKAARRVRHLATNVSLVPFVPVLRELLRSSEFDFNKWHLKRNLWLWIEWKLKRISGWRLRSRWRLTWSVDSLLDLRIWWRFQLDRFRASVFPVSIFAESSRHPRIFEAKQPKTNKATSHGNGPLATENSRIQFEFYVQKWVRIVVRVKLCTKFIVKSIECFIENCASCVSWVLWNGSIWKSAKMSKLDDLLGKKKEIVPVLDLSKTIVHTKEEYKRLLEKVPDYKMRPIKVLLQWVCSMRWPSFESLTIFRVFFWIALGSSGGDKNQGSRKERSLYDAEKGNETSDAKQRGSRSGLRLFGSDTSGNAIPGHHGAMHCAHRLENADDNATQDENWGRILQQVSWTRGRWDLAPLSFAPLLPTDSSNWGNYKSKRSCETNESICWMQPFERWKTSRE